MPKTLPSSVCRALQSEGAEPQLAAIVAHFVEYVGGEKAMGKLMFDAYRDPRATPATRQRVLDMVCYGLRFANTQAGPKDDLGAASDDDLVREAEALILKLDRTRGAASA